jgi:type III secretion protein J
MSFRFFALALSLLLTACTGTPLYSNLTEQQANEVLAALLRANLDADKMRTAGNDPVWTVHVSSEQFDQAMTVLRASGLPSAAKESLGDVFKKEGFVSSALEEKARYIYALEQGFEATIMGIDGVVNASVHIALPERDLLTDEVRPARASVTIIKAPTAKIEQQKANIISIVKNGVEGLDSADNITVIFFDAHQTPAPTPRSGLFTSQRSIAVAVSGLLAVIAIGFGLGLVLRARKGQG